MNLFSASLESAAFLPLLLKWKKPEPLLQSMLTHSQTAGELGHSWDKQIPVCSALTLTPHSPFPELAAGFPPQGCCLPLHPVPVRSSASSHTPIDEGLINDILAVVPGHPVCLYTLWVHCFAAASTSS